MEPSAVQLCGPWSKFLVISPRQDPVDITILKVVAVVPMIFSLFYYAYCWTERYSAPCSVDSTQTVATNPEQPHPIAPEIPKAAAPTEQPLTHRELANALGFLLTKVKFDQARPGSQSTIDHRLLSRKQFYDESPKCKMPPPPSDVALEFRTLSPLRKGYVLLALPNIVDWNEKTCRKALIAIQLIRDIPNRLLDTQLKKMRALCATLLDLSNTKNGLEEFAQIFSCVQDFTAKKILLFTPKLDLCTALLLEEQEDSKVAKGILQIYGIAATEELVNRLTSKQHFRYLIPFFSVEERDACREVLQAVLRSDEQQATTVLESSLVDPAHEVVRTNAPWLKFIAHLGDCWSPQYNGYKKLLKDHVLQPNVYIIAIRDRQSNHLIRGSATYSFEEPFTEMNLGCEFSLLGPQRELSDTVKLYEIILDACCRYGVQRNIPIRYDDEGWIPQEVRHQYAPGDFLKPTEGR